MLWGVATVSAFLLPLANLIAGLGLTIFFFILLPLSLIRRARPQVAVMTLWIAQALGLYVWMASFTTIWFWLGLFGLLAFLMFHFVAPIAIIGLMIKGQAGEAGSLLVSLALTYFLRFYAVWILAKSDVPHKPAKDDYKGPIIDVTPMKKGDS